LLAGVDDAALYFLKQPRLERRRAVLVITDNYGQRSRRTQTVVTRLWEADATLAGLIVRSAAATAMHTARMVHPTGLALGLVLQEGIDGVADKTGGETLKAGDAGVAFQQMMQRLRRRYSLYYAMPDAKPGETRQVKVELTDEAKKNFAGARVRARKGYRVPVAEKAQEPPSEGRFSRRKKPAE
jgi:hypothetical protein